MNKQNELNFIKQVTAGWFNKDGTSFDFGTSPLRGGGNDINMILVNYKSSTSATYQRVTINYNTVEDDVHIKMTIGIFDTIVSVKLPKQEAVTYLSTLIESSEWGEKPLTKEDGEVDFYNILEQLEDQVFSQEDLFELNKWNSELYIYEQVGEKYGKMQNAYHVHGGVGSAPDHNRLHDITTTVELATSPSDNKTYLNVRRNLTDNPKYPHGLYENGTFEMFVESIVEQYKGAWNRSK
ncbi:hypothetical protein ACQUY5_20190 [Bacillus cereus]|uniref:hypothetical protein n=1 Tax=Bacillus cereus TaxID=1396 RepID=UPI003D172922